MDLQTIVSFLIASALLTISPGPDIIYVLTQSIANGKKYGIATTLGLVSGILIHTSFIAFGVSAIIKQSESIYFSIKVLGAVYLLYLAYQVYSSSNKINLKLDSDQKFTLIALFKKGFFMNVLNPKVTIFFLAFFPAFVNVSKGNSTQQIFLLGFIFMMQAFLIFSAVAVISDKMTGFLRENKRFTAMLKWIQIVVFIGIAIFIVFS